MKTHRPFRASRSEFPSELRPGKRPAAAATTSAPAAPPPRPIETHNEVPGFNASKKSVARLFGLLDTYPARRIPLGELSVAFLGDDGIRRLHQQFFNDPDLTDVITFPGDPAPDPAAPASSQDTTDVPAPPPAFAGEICVCVPQARREAATHGNTVRDEILLYLIHGWLHLSGLDDHSDDDQIQMRAAEKHLLHWLSRRSFTPAWGE